MKLPWFDISGGIRKFGSRSDPERPSQRKRSSVTGVFDRRLLAPPFRQQPVEADRIDHRAGEDVRADLRAFFQEHDGKLGVDLLQPDGGGQARRAGADHDHVVFHALALGQALRFRTFCSLEQFNCIGIAGRARTCP